MIVYHLIKYCSKANSIKTEAVNAVLKQKQPSEVFYKKAVFKNYTIFTENICTGVSFR